MREIISDSDEEDKLTTQKIVEYYFENCPADRINPSTCKYKALIAAKEGSSEADGRIYCVNKEMFNESNTDIKIQDEKFKVFYFHQDGHMALLDNFLMHIAKNASEFRYLPDMDDILNKKDYTELFTLVYDGSIYKLRDVTKVRMDKYTLSKFLGKYRKVGAMIQDFKEIVFEKNILTILDKHILIENYTLWDRLLEIYIVNDRLDYYEEMAVKLFDAILELDYPDTIVNNKSNPQKALILFLHTAICRTTALRWGKEINETISKIIKKATKKAEEKVEDSSIKRLILKLLTIKTIEKMRLNFCKTRMINKYVTLIPIDFIKLKTIKTTEESIRLYKLEDVISHMRDDNKDDNNGDENLEDYIYHPYMVTPQEISYALACYDISKGRRMDPSYQFNKLTELYLKWNYCKDNKSESDDESPVFKDIDIYKFNNDSIIKNRDRYIISVKNDNLEKLKVAIGNARINTADFQNTLIGKPNRSLKRYQKLSELLHTAVSENVDLLVLPENYLPLEWIPDIARLCANNQIALVTGIEHVIFPKNIKGKHRVYNLTAVILPYRVEEYKYAYVIYHHKVNYSPEEKRIIAGYRYEPFEGDSFHLFYWSDIWFSVYCCYELASIQGRSVFGSLPDALIAVEWNKDVAYFSSIVESLSRDLHCYCIQANSSDYGDSRVILPSSMVMRDLIKTKGGINSAVLIDEINIKKLREFQLKEYELQKEDGSFKPTPPDFNHDIPKYKLNGELLDYMENNGIIKSMRKTCCNS